MITIKKSKDLITISGHANYSEHGSDIVCASVSSIAITTVNAIMKIDSEAIDFNEKDGFLEISIKKNQKIVNILLNNMISLFEELESNYPDNIKIK